MTELSKTVRKNSKIRFLERISSCLLVISTFLCGYLNGQFEGFIKGDNYATALYSEGHPEYSFSGSGRPVYELMSEDYFFLLVVLLITLSFHLLTNAIASKIINLFLLCLVFKIAFSIFHFKGGLFDVENFESQYFDIVRQTIKFDIAGAAAIAVFFIIQVILVLLILNERKLKPLDIKIG